MRREGRVEEVVLKYCPFCGGEAEFRVTNSHWKNGGGVGVRCKECKALSATRQGPDAKLRAAELWNRTVEL